MKTVFTLAFVLAAVAASPARAADTVEDAMRSLGLLGHWARQCEAPASGLNNHITFTKISTGEVQEIFDFGPDGPQNIYTVISAAPEAAAPDEIHLVLVFRGNAMDVILKAQDHTIRTKSSIRKDGTVLVKDGIKLFNGDATNVLHYCD